MMGERGPEQYQERSEILKSYAARLERDEEPTVVWELRDEIIAQAGSDAAADVRGLFNDFDDNLDLAERDEEGNYAHATDREAVLAALGQLAEQLAMDRAA